MQRRQVRADKQLSVAQQENKRLRERLREAEQKLPELRGQLEDGEQAKAKMAVRPPQGSDHIIYRSRFHQLSSVNHILLDICLFSEIFGCCEVVFFSTFA